MLEASSGPPGLCLRDAECPAEHECIAGLCALRGCGTAERACLAPTSVCAPALATFYGWNETPDTACALPCTVGVGDVFGIARGCSGAGSGCFTPAGEARAEAGFCASASPGASRIARRNLGEGCNELTQCWTPFDRGACTTIERFWSGHLSLGSASGLGRCQIFQCDDPGLPDLCGPAHRCTEVPGTTVTYCAPRCGGPSDCEPGYGCFDEDGSAATPSVCVPGCLADADCDERAPAERELRCELDPVRRIGRCVARSACETATAIGPSTPVDATGAWVLDLDFSRLPTPPLDPTLSDRCPVAYDATTSRERVVRLVPRTSGILRVLADEEEDQAYNAALVSVRTACELPLTALLTEAGSGGIGRGCASQRVDVPVRAGVPVSIVVTDVHGLAHHRARVWLAPYRREGEACDPRGLLDDCGSLRCIARNESGARCGAPPTCDAPFDFRAGARATADGTLCWSGERPNGEVGNPLVFRVPRDVVFDPPIRACNVCPDSSSSCPMVTSAREGEVLIPGWESLCPAPPCDVSGNGAVGAGEACEGEQIGIHMLAVRRDGEPCDPAGRLDRCEDGLSCARLGGALEPRCTLLATSCEEPAPLDALSSIEGDARVFTVWPGLAAECGFDDYAYLDIEAWADGTLELERPGGARLQAYEVPTCGACPTRSFRVFRRDVRRGEVVRVAIVPDVFFGDPVVMPGVTARVVPLPVTDEACEPTVGCAAGLSCVAIGSLGRCEAAQEDEGACALPSGLLEGWDGAQVAGVATLQRGVSAGASCVRSWSFGEVHGQWLRVPAPRAGVLVASARTSSTFVSNYVAVSFWRSCAEADEISCGSGYVREGEGEAQARATAAVDAGEELLLWVGNQEGEPVMLDLALADPLPLGAPCDHDSLTEACGAGLICADVGGASPSCIEDPWR